MSNYALPPPPRAAALAANARLTKISLPSPCQRASNTFQTQKSPNFRLPKRTGAEVANIEANFRSFIERIVAVEDCCEMLRLTEQMISASGTNNWKKGFVKYGGFDAISSWITNETKQLTTKSLQVFIKLLDFVNILPVNDKSEIHSLLRILDLFMSPRFVKVIPEDTATDNIARIHYLAERIKFKFLVLATSTVEAYDLIAAEDAQQLQESVSKYELSKSLASAQLHSQTPTPDENHPAAPSLEATDDAPTTFDSLVQKHLPVQQIIEIKSSNSTPNCGLCNKENLTPGRQTASRLSRSGSSFSEDRHFRGEFREQNSFPYRRHDHRRSPSTPMSAYAEKVQHKNPCHDHNKWLNDRRHASPGNDRDRDRRRRRDRQRRHHRLTKTRFSDSNTTPLPVYTDVQHSMIIGGYSVPDYMSMQGGYPTPAFMQYGYPTPVFTQSYIPQPMLSSPFYQVPPPPPPPNEVPLPVQPIPPAIDNDKKRRFKEAVVPLVFEYMLSVADCTKHNSGELHQLARLVTRTVIQKERTLGNSELLVTKDVIARAKKEADKCLSKF